MYLWHMNVLAFVLKWFPIADDPQVPDECTHSTGEAFRRWLSIACVGLIVSLMVAFLSYVLIEKPFIEARRVLTAPKKVVEMLLSLNS